MEGPPRRTLTWLCAAVAIAPLRLAGQTDTASAPPMFHLEQLVVVAHRTPTPMYEAVASTALFTRADIEALNAGTLWEVLQHVPGITFVERDGAGQLPMAIARGFFGGGETSYVLVTVDGVPANETRTGLVEWNLIPPSRVERIEVLRGSASVTYGDAALGAVVNIITRPTGDRLSGSATLTGGSWGDAGFSGTVEVPWRSARLGAVLTRERASGYRDHALSDRMLSVLTLRMRRADGGAVSARLTASRLENEEPGALAPEGLARDPRSAHPMFKNDARVRWTTSASLGLQRARRSGSLTADARVRVVDQERVRTLLLTPAFGDTQLQDERSWSVWGRALYTRPIANGTFTFGGESEMAAYRTSYCDPLACGEPLSTGRGRLWRGAVHADLSHSIASRARLNAGLRLDLVRPAEAGPGATDPPLFRQWSPRLAVNVAYRRTATSRGAVYASWTRAFKAPTLDQLYDVRRIPSGQPGTAFNISSPDLQPQRSSAFEIGVLQVVPLGGPFRHAELSAAVYHQQLDDEIDLDLRTFKYGNILRSRHQGAEIGLRLRLSRELLLTQSLTLSSVTFRAGEYIGNQVKNVPTRTLVHHVRWAPVARLQLGLGHRGLGGVYLDDANSARLDGANLFDASVGFALGPADLSIAVRNLFGTRHDGVGLLLHDPARNEDAPMIFPGGGRFLRVVLSYGSGS